MKPDAKEFILNWRCLYWYDINISGALLIANKKLIHIFIFIDCYLFLKE